MSPRFVLASSSPRRRELLAQLDLDFDVIAPDGDETPLPGEAPVAYVERIARAKAEAVAARVEGAAAVLAADTTVELDGEPLGKPHDDATAAAMLRRLRNRTHRVHTAVASVTDGLLSIVATTDVTMAPMSDGEISWYVATGEPHDKAGAYGIQGRGGIFVKEIAGSYSNVVGLPLAETVMLLRRGGVETVDRHFS